MVLLGLIFKNNLILIVLLDLLVKVPFQGSF